MSKQVTTHAGKGVLSIVRNALYLLGTQGISHGVRIIYIAIIARYLGPELYGLYSYGQAWYMSLLPLTTIGLGVILSREVGRSPSEGVQVVTQTWTLRTITTLAIAIASGLAGWFFEEQPEARNLILIFSLALMGRAISLWTTQVAVAYEAARYSFLQYALFRPFEALAGSAMLLAGYGVVTVAWMHTLSWWLQSLYGLLLVRRHLVPVKSTWQWRVLFSLLGQGLPIGIGAVLVSWFQQGPVVMFRHIVDDEATLGQLALALRAFMMFSTVASTVSLAALPILSRTVVRQDGKDRVFIESMLWIGFIFGAAISFVGMAMGPSLVDALLGPRYALAGRLFGPTLWLLIPWGWGNAAWGVALVRGQVFSSCLCAAAGTAVMGITLPSLILNFGALGALMAAGAGMGLWAICVLVLLRRGSPLDIRRTLVKPGMVVLVALGFFYALEWVHTLLALFAALLSLAGGLLVSGTVSSEERSTLTSFWRVKPASNITVDTSRKINALES